MDIQEFNRRIRQQAQQISGLLNRRMPVLAGNIAKRHIEEDFRKGGFTGRGFHRWKETRRQRGSGNSAASQYGPLLSGRNHLSGSINFRPENRLVRVYTNVPYAAVHNNGGTLHPTVTPQMRKFAWAMYYKTAGIKKGMKKGGKKAYGTYRKRIGRGTHVEKAGADTEETSQSPYTKTAVHAGYLQQ